MNRIVRVFKSLKKENSKALIPYITAGDPDLKGTREVLRLFAESGADIIELGVPFSDPMADGPVIQRAMERALSSGTDLYGIFDLVSSFRESFDVPIVLMGYYNPFYAYGIERFVRDAKDAGVDGVLTVDLPPEEAGQMRQLLHSNGMTPIFLTTPVSDGERIKVIKRVAEGFIYFVSITGVTGERDTLPDDIVEKMNRIRSFTNLPVVLGFGISDPDTIGRFYDGADGFVIGSAIVRRWQAVQEGKERLAGFSGFLERLAHACHRG